jgi:hypothetical protein
MRTIEGSTTSKKGLHPMAARIAATVISAEQQRKLCMKRK